MRRPGGIGRNGTSKRAGPEPSALVRRTSTIDDFRRRPASGQEASCVLAPTLVGTRKLLFFVLPPVFRRLLIFLRTAFLRVAVLRDGDLRTAAFRVAALRVIALRRDADRRVEAPEVYPSVAS